MHNQICINGCEGYCKCGVLLQSEIDIVHTCFNISIIIKYIDDMDNQPNDI